MKLTRARSAARKKTTSLTIQKDGDNRPFVPTKDRRLNFGNKWNYTPAPETVPVKIQSRYELFINGKFSAPGSGKYFESINPATEQKLTDIAAANLIGPML